MIALYPGSFDPVTRGHLAIIRRALRFCPQLVVAVGGNIAKQNLFTVEERIALLHGALAEMFTAEEMTRLTVTAFSGGVIHYAQSVNATLIVKGMRGNDDYAHEERMAIVNRRLDPAIDTVFLMAENDLRDVSSSAVRELAAIGVGADTLDHYLTPSVRKALLARIPQTS